jgi:hypothetical protein
LLIPSTVFLTKLLSDQTTYCFYELKGKTLIPLLTYFVDKSHTYRIATIQNFTPKLADASQNIISSYTYSLPETIRKTVDVTGSKLITATL